jgi:putative tricarboxylic transport membrane protein
MRVNDAVSGTLLALFGLAIAAYAQTFSSRPGMAFGPGLFPTIIGILLALGGLVLAWQGWRRGGPMLEIPAWIRSPRHLLGIPVLLALLAFYILLVDRLGFLLTAFVMLAAFQAWLGVRLRTALPVAALASIGFYVAFSRLLAVPLPVTYLETLFW